MAILIIFFFVFFFFKQKTAYEMSIGDWSSDVCSSDLYYAYLWSEVLDDDAYAWFKEHGGMTRANGGRFREMILSRGGTGDMGALYRAFRGRDPDVAPLLEERGLQADQK